MARKTTRERRDLTLAFMIGFAILIVLIVTMVFLAMNDLRITEEQEARAAAAVAEMDRTQQKYNAERKAEEQADRKRLGY